jgi:hypothetical protein
LNDAQVVMVKHLGRKACGKAQDAVKVVPEREVMADWKKNLQICSNVGAL